MGILIWAHENDEEEQNGGIKFSRSYNKRYTNKNAVSNVIRDITRTRENEKYANQLICYGAVGCGCDIPADCMIQEFLYIQNIYNIESRQGKRIYHEIFSMLDEEIASLNYNMTYLNYFALDCARWYYEHGFQVVYAIHKQSKFHIHFAVNSINYKTGAKFHTSKNEKAMREQIFNLILNEYWKRSKVPIAPVLFYPNYTA